MGVLVVFEGANGVDITEAGKDVAMQIAAMSPVAVDKDGVDPATIEREIEIAKDVIRAEGKPEEMVEKIAAGKLNKFYKDSTLSVSYTHLDVYKRQKFIRWYCRFKPLTGCNFLNRR